MKHLTKEKLTLIINCFLKPLSWIVGLNLFIPTAPPPPCQKAILIINAGLPPNMSASLTTVQSQPLNNVSTQTATEKLDQISMI